MCQLTTAIIQRLDTICDCSIINPAVEKHPKIHPLSSVSTTIWMVAKLTYKPISTRADMSEVSCLDDPTLKEVLFHFSTSVSSILPVELRQLCELNRPCMEGEWAQHETMQMDMIAMWKSAEGQMSSSLLSPFEGSCSPTAVNFVSAAQGNKMTPHYEHEGHSDRAVEVIWSRKSKLCKSYCTWWRYGRVRGSSCKPTRGGQIVWRI